MRLLEFCNNIISRDGWEKAQLSVNDPLAKTGALYFEHLTLTYVPEGRVASIYVSNNTGRIKMGEAIRQCCALMKNIKCNYELLYFFAGATSVREISEVKFIDGNFILIPKED